MSKMISTFRHDVIPPSEFMFHHEAVDNADRAPTVDRNSDAYREGYAAAMAGYSAESTRRDAANAEAEADAAWRRSVNDLNAWRSNPEPRNVDLNAWRNEPVASAPKPHTTPTRGDASTVTAADAERAWQESVNNLNAWRNER